MKTIVKIEKIKGKKGYRNVVFDDSSKLETDDELINYFRLKEGSEYEDKELKKIKDLAERKFAKDRALEFLKYGSRSEREIRKKLYERRVKKGIIDEIVNDLKRVGFINDKEFALRFSRNFINRRPAGAILLKNELKKRGIKSEIIDETLKNVYSEFDKKELALKLIEKKKFDLSSNDPKIKKKIYDLLLRRGFDWGIVGELMRENIG